jgi:hypothetical protein
VEAQPASKLASIEPTSARRHARVRVLLSAKLVTTTEETNVKIRDVSLSGAMLQGRSLPRVGSDAIVSRGSFEIFTTVIWRRDDLCGVQFDTPLSCFEELLEAGTTHASMVGFIPMPRHRPLEASDDTMEDRMEAARAWAFPVGRQAFLD